MGDEGGERGSSILVKDRERVLVEQLWCVLHRGAGQASRRQ